MGKCTRLLEQGNLYLDMQACMQRILTNQIHAMLAPPRLGSLVQKRRGRKPEKARLGSSRLVNILVLFNLAPYIRRAFNGRAVFTSPRRSLRTGIIEALNADLPQKRAPETILYPTMASNEAHDWTAGR